MKLSQTNGSLLSITGSEEKSVAALASAGFKCIDVSFFEMFKPNSPYWDDDYAMKIVDIYKAAFEKYGVTPVQCHEPAGNAIGDDEGNYFFKKTSKALKMAALIGCPSITVHPGTANHIALSQDEFITRNVASISRLIPLAEQYNIDILLENIGTPGENYWLHNAAELSQLIDAFNSEKVGANWDIGHANLNGCGQYTNIMYLGKRLKGIHAHDNRGFIQGSAPGINGSDMHVIPFEGKINWDSVMRGLIDTGYKGTMNFEVSIIGTPDAKFCEIGGMNEDEARMYHSLLYNIGKRMLTSYKCFEE